MKQGEGKARIVGSPITYGLTMPTVAPQPALARAFVAMFIGEKGGRLLRRRGFQPAGHPFCNPCSGLPNELLSRVVPAP